MKYEQIKPYIEKGLISEQAHPEDENVRIFNYTHRCQYEHAWDEVTMLCRGLIMNIATEEILARPFPKFFNYEEHIGQGKSIPSELPSITEKFDGSLGIMYTLNGKTRIATRGSFTSDQALWATEWWEKEKGLTMYGNKLTHLFEIIYPANRIVVNYDFSGLIHLTTLDTKTGIPVEYSLPVKRAQQLHVLDSKDIAFLTQTERPNAEGYVIYFPSTNLRLKVKFKEYVRLHRILTGVSARVIWDLLRNNQDLTEILERVPDEFYNWVKETKLKLTKQFDAIATEAVLEFQKAREKNPETRKEWAEEIKKMKNPSIGFAILDDKDFKSIIWKMIKPTAEKPFKEDEN